MSEAMPPIDPVRTPAAAALAGLASSAAAFAADPLGRRMIEAFRGVELGASGAGTSPEYAEPSVHVGPTRAQIAKDLGLTAHGQLALASLMDGPGSRLEATLRQVLKALPAAIDRPIFVADLSLDADGRPLVEVDGLFLNGIALVNGLATLDEAVAVLARFESGLAALPSDRLPGTPEGIDRLPFRIRAYGAWMEHLPPALRDEFPPTVLAGGPAEAWGLFRLALRAILGVETDSDIPELYDNGPKVEVQIALPARSLATE